ncbi:MULTISPECIES: GntR family transcriptional regulator [unclassified Streptomyces]|uniref:GntR family transcriptional regulator n=1 Tax=unclassified Streptomyces TaxID=2593676 RepID=UPI0033A3F7FA
MATKSEEIADALAARIGPGRDYPPDSTLPGFDELTREFGVSRLTISRAVELLARRNLVRTVKKTGIIVLQPVARRTVREIVRRSANGYVFPVAASAPGPWILHGRHQVGRLPLPEPVAELFGLDPGTLALRLRRVSSPPGEPPLQLADTWLHLAELDSLPELETWEPGIGGHLDVIEQKAGHGPLSWERRERVDMPTSEEAQLLQVARQLPVWRQYTIGTSGRTDRPVEVTAAVIPGARIEYATKLRRDGSARWPVEAVTPAPVSFDVG